MLSHLAACGYDPAAGETGKIADRTIAEFEQMRAGQFPPDTTHSNTWPNPIRFHYMRDASQTWWPLGGMWYTPYALAAWIGVSALIVRRIRRRNRRYVDELQNRFAAKAVAAPPSDSVTGAQ